METSFAGRTSASVQMVARILLACWIATLASNARAADKDDERVLFKVSSQSQRLRMTINTSRILTMDKKIPKAQVSNPSIAELTPLSPTQIQIYARKTGVTQVNLWDEDDVIHSIDVVIMGDAEELRIILEEEFPNASLRIRPLANAVLLSGVVDDPDHVDRIMEIARDYYPDVKNNIAVGGVQQVVLQVRVYEISRTDLRTLGVDWGWLGGSGDMAASSISGLLGAVSSATGSVTGFGTNSNTTFRWGVVDGGSSFFSFLEAARQNDLAKVLAEPNLTAVSGRPAFFNVGGEFPILVPQSLGTVTIQYRRYGTQLDFVPICLGGNNIRLEVRPRVSEIDPTRSVTVNGLLVPGLRVSEVDTGVEMKAGQTLALAGLVQTRVENQTKGIPFLGDLPWIGTAFRKTKARHSEVEVLIMVTPQLVEALDPEEVSPCYPGITGDRPSDVDLYFRGHLETPGCWPLSGCPDNGQGSPLLSGRHPEHQMMPEGEEIGPGEIIEENQVSPPSIQMEQPSQPTAAPQNGSSARKDRRVPAQPVSTGKRAPRDARENSGQRKPTPSQPWRSASKAPKLIGPVGYDSNS